MHRSRRFFSENLEFSQKEIRITLGADDFFVSKNDLEELLLELEHDVELLVELG